MIQDIRRVDPKLDRFALRDSECLAEICVKPDDAEALYRGQSEIPLLSRSRVYQQVLNRPSIVQRHGSWGSRRDFPRNSPEIAVHSRCPGRPALRDRALWILDRDVGVRIAKISSNVVLAVPSRGAGTRVPRSDDVRYSGAVGQPSKRVDTCRSAAGQIQNDACLPAFENARQPA